MMEDQSEPAALCACCARVFSSDWVPTRFGQAISPDEQSGAIWMCISQTSGEPYAINHHNGSELLECSKLGSCHVCRLLWKYLQYIPNRYQENIEFNEADVTHVEIQRSTSEIEIHFTYDSPAQVPLSQVTLNLIPCASIAAPYDGTTTEKFQTNLQDCCPTDETLISRAVHKKLAHWLQDCVNHHPICQSSQVTMRGHESNRLPTRLLDLGTQRGSMHVRICFGGDLPLSTRYASLSHCWGKDGPSLKLTEAVLPEFTSHIPLSSIPQTFVDAFLISQTLGIRYVWIDALCIIQDSPLDWQHEALLMGKVYSNAYINIAATSATSGQSGFSRYKKSPDTAGVPCQIMATWSGLTPGNYVALSTNEWDHCVEGKGINSRGWVLQERLQAVRTIHMTEEQVYWECANGRSSECFPQGIPLLESSPHFVDTYNQAVRPVGLNPGVRSVQELNRFWFAVVQEYSRRSFSFVSDKLIALSGVAQAMASTFPDSAQPVRYLAGLWQLSHIELCQGLLWFMADGKSCRHREYTAPSWSWASVTGPVRFAKHTHSFDCIQILEAVVIYDTNMWGKVIDGFLKVRGSLYRCQISYTSSLSTQEGPLLKRRGPYEVWIGGARADPFSLTVAFDDTAPQIWWDTSTAIDCYFLTFTKSSRAFMSERAAEGLLLAPVDTKPGCFSRIGLLDLTLAPNSNDIDLCHVDCAIGQDDHIAAHDDGTFTIEIL